MKVILAPLVFLLISALAGVAQTAVAETPAARTVEHYKLDFRLDPAHHALAADAEISLRNTGDHPMTTVPILLYRLMDVGQVSDAAGKPLSFTQKVLKFPDDPVWQVNAAEVTLPTPLAPGQQMAIKVKYGGQLFGYSEAWAYVHDTISEGYSLIRSETFSYPTIAEPSQAARRQSARRAKYDYEINTTVPEGFIALCSGDDTAAPVTKNGELTFHCIGAPGSTSLNVAAARFKGFTDPEGGVRVYALPADAADGARILSEMRRSLDFYRSYLGRAQGGRLTLIEIPDGWGSYETGDHIFQAAAAFKDKDRAHELWHEIAHRWIKVCEFGACDPRVQRTRYFEEAFATYFEALAVRQFQGEDAFRKYMELTREDFINDATKDSGGRTTAIAEYGRDEIGGFSYNKGAWSLYVLHQLLGEEDFRRSVSAFLGAYDGKVDFPDFLRSLEKTSGRDLQPWFRQWILSGSESSEMLFQGRTVEEMVARCKAE